MQLSILRQADLPRYGIAEDDFSPDIPLLALGIADQDTPMALLLATVTDAVHVFHLACLKTWDEAPLRQLILAAGIWARSSGIPRAACRLSLPMEQARSVARILSRSGWAMGPSTVQLCLSMDEIKPEPCTQTNPSQQAIRPFFQLSLPTRARFFSTHSDIDVPSLGALEPKLCIGCAGQDRLDGCILTGRLGQQYACSVWLPEDPHLSEQMLCLLVRLCQKRQIHSLLLKTCQKNTPEQIHHLCSTGVKVVGVQIQGSWASQQPGGQKGE